MTEDISKGLQELFAAKPELFAEVKTMIEAVHEFLYDAEGGDVDNCIEVWNGCVPAIIEAAQEIPELKAWAEQLDDFEETERAKCMIGTSSAA